MIKNHPSVGWLNKFDLFFGFDSFNFAKFLTGMEIGYSFILLTKPYLSHYLFWAGLFTGLSVELYGIIQRKQQIMHFSWILRILQAILLLCTLTRPLLNNSISKISTIAFGICSVHSFTSGTSVRNGDFENIFDLAKFFL